MQRRYLDLFIIIFGFGIARAAQAPHPHATFDLHAVFTSQQNNALDLQRQRSVFNDIWLARHFRQNEFVQTLPAVNIQFTQDKFSLLQAQISPDILRNNVLRYTLEKQDLPIVLLKESALYLRNGLGEINTFSKPFHHINPTFSAHFDKELSALYNDLSIAKNFKDQLQANIASSNGIVKTQYECAYIQCAGLIDTLQFVIDVKQRCLDHHNPIIQSYDAACRHAEECYKTKSLDTISPLLEEQATVIKFRIDYENQSIIKQNAILKEAQENIARVDHFYNIFEREELQEYKVDKQNALNSIQQSEATIKICNAELQKLEPLIAYGRQCKEQVEKIASANTRQVNSNLYSSQELHMYASKDSGLAKAIEETRLELGSVKTVEHSLDSKTFGALEKLGIDTKNEFALQLAGDAVQHYVQKELLGSLDRLGNAEKMPENIHGILKVAVACNISGQKAVRQKQIVYALEAKEACDRLLDLGLAIGEGFVEGVHNTCDNTIDFAQGTINVIRGNPKTLSKITATFTGASQAMTTFLSKYGRWMELKLENPEKARQIRNAYFARIGDGVSQRLSEMSERDKVKFVARFATEWFLAGEVAAVTGKAMRAGKVVAEEVVLNPLKTLQYEVSEALVATLEKEPALVNGFVEGIEKIGQDIIASGKISREFIEATWAESKELKLLKDVVEKSMAPNHKIIKIEAILDAPVSELLKRELEAERIYNLARGSISDVTKISKNTGIPEEIIKKIKNHVFYEDHILSNGIRKFDSAIDMAKAWERLTNGTHARLDMKLLLHEFAESLIMQGTKVSYDDAHYLIEEIYPWWSTF